MSGLYSRRKGRTGEQDLVLALREAGFENVRRGLCREDSKDVRPDVLGVYQGREYMFEHKFFSTRFIPVYKSLESLGLVDTLRYSTELGEIAISYNPTEVLRMGFDAVFITYPADKHIKKLWTLKQMLKGSEILVIKGNHKKRVYLRYWPRVQG